MEIYRIQMFDESCLDRCKCGCKPHTLQMSTFTTTCGNCSEYVQGADYVEVMVKWNKLQRKTKNTL